MSALTDRQEKSLEEEFQNIEKELDAEIEDTKNDERLQEIEILLSNIPPATKKTDLSRILNPLFEKLSFIDDLTAINFICNDLRAHFNIKTQKETDLYIRRYKDIRRKNLNELHAKKRGKAVAQLITDRDINSEEVYDAISAVGIIPKEIFEIVLAVCISSKLRLAPPLWLLLIGAPSSCKTELVEMFRSLNEVYTIDTMTENALISGYMPTDGSEPQDMLPLLDGKCFIVKDLTTIFSLNEDSVKKLLGDFTGIFDGTFEKHMGTRGTISYNSLFSMIGCITPSILSKHHNYVNQLGSRFVFLRIPDLNDDTRERGFTIAWSGKEREKRVKHARMLVASYAAQIIGKLSKETLCDITDGVTRQWINDAADLVARGRGIAITRAKKFTNNQGKEVEYYEVIDWQIEQPWRAFNQIKSLIELLALTRGKNSPGMAELETIKLVVLSTMQVDRSEIVRLLLDSPGMTRQEIANKLGKSSKTIGRTLKELETLTLMDSYKEEPTFPAKNFIAQRFVSILKPPSTPEFMSPLQERQSSLFIPNEMDEGGGIKPNEV